MNKFLSILIGIGMIGYLTYVLVQVIQIAFGSGGGSWSDISTHLVIIGVLIALIIIGHFWGNRKEETTEDSKPSPIRSEASGETTTPEKPSYYPLVDKLEFSIYQQSFESWWSDNDGDKHYHSTIYANLRFYEDGIVIGIRSSLIPKREVPDSFTMKGKWTTEKNTISFKLEKVSEKDDSISIYIPEADRREMKYYGEIANDNSLIKAGNFKGIIKGKTLHIGNHVFHKIPLLKLIVTNEEKNCEQLEAKLENHPLIVDTFQDTGNWYSNGETGPEWFTLHIYTAEKSQQEVEALVMEELNKLGESGNLFWDKG